MNKNVYKIEKNFEGKRLDWWLKKIFEYKFFIYFKTHSDRSSKSK